MRRLHEYISENLALRHSESILKSLGGENITMTKGYFKASFPDREKAEQVVAMFEGQDFDGVKLRQDDTEDGHFIVEWSHK